MTPSLVIPPAVESERRTYEVVMHGRYPGVMRLLVGRFGVVVIGLYRSFLDSFSVFKEKFSILLLQ